MLRKHTVIFGLIVMLPAIACNLHLIGQNHSAGTGEVDEVQMGDLYRNDDGFSFLTLPGYEIEEIEGRVSMFPTPSDNQSGPYVVLNSRLAEEDITLNQALDYTQKANNSALFEEIEEINVQGLPALSVEYRRPYHSIDGVILDYYGADEGEQIRGWFVLVEVSPGHIFRLEVFAPAHLWAEVLPSFETLVGSLCFVE